jgi:hypothetical protein
VLTVWEIENGIVDFAMLSDAVEKIPPPTQKGNGYPNAADDCDDD